MMTVMGKGYQEQGQKATGESRRSQKQQEIITATTTTTTGIAARVDDSFKCECQGERERVCRRGWEEQ